MRLPLLKKKTCEKTMKSRHETAYIKTNFVIVHFCDPFFKTFSMKSNEIFLHFFVWLDFETRNHIEIMGNPIF